MSEFKKRIEGKSIALVGPAAYLQGSKYGKKIDNHDTVVRINRGVELVDKYEEDIGKQTDILYSCLIEKAANAGKVNGKRLKEKYGVKYLCAPPESTFDGIATKSKFHHMVNDNTVKEILRHIPVRIVDHGLHTDLAKKVKCRPNTGFLAIYDLLQQNPKELSIYGFSFYLDGFMPGCKEGIIQEKNKTEKEFANDCFNSKRHIQKNLWRYAKDTLLENELVHLDPYLKMILSMNQFSTEQFIKKTKEGKNA